MTPLGHQKLSSSKEKYIECIDNLFLKLELAYHYQFYKVFGTDDRLNEGKKLWAISLKSFSTETITEATENVIGAQSYLPTLTDFLKACSEINSHNGFPSVEEAYIEARKSYAPRTEYSWSHPIVYFTGKKIGWNFLDEKDSRELFSSFKKIFNRFSLIHGYRSSMTINNFQTNLDFQTTSPFKKDDGDNFLVQRLFGNINLVEQFNPLLRLDLEFKNSLKFLAEVKRDRALSLSLDNNILTESFGDEFILGLGYRIKDLQFRSRVAGRQRTLKGDLNMKADISYRNNITVLRNIEIDNNQVTAGQTLWSIKISADYNLSQNLTALFFYDHNFSKFAIELLVLSNKN